MVDQIINTQAGIEIGVAATKSFTAQLLGFYLLALDLSYRRQFKCDNCRKPFSEELDFVAKKRTYTKRLAENILEQLKEGDILNVSRRNDVTEEESQRMIEDIAEEITETDLSKLKSGVRRHDCVSCTHFPDICRVLSVLQVQILDPYFISDRENVDSKTLSIPFGFVPFHSSLIHRHFILILCYLFS